MNDDENDRNTNDESNDSTPNAMSNEESAERWGHLRDIQSLVRHSLFSSFSISYFVLSILLLALTNSLNMSHLFFKNVIFGYLLIYSFMWIFGSEIRFTLYIKHNLANRKTTIITYVLMIISSYLLYKIGLPPIISYLTSLSCSVSSTLMISLITFSLTLYLFLLHFTAGFILLKCNTHE